MQKFDKYQQEKFIKYFKIKENPTQIELDFYDKTEEYIKYIKWIPGLRMVWIWNSISMNCATKDSDIDLLIVTTNETIWLNRIIITIIFQLLWVRKTATNHAGRFCLSFFSTLEWLDFNSWKLENDIYLYFWVLYFKPVLDYGNTYSLFLNKNSSWVDFSDYSSILENNKTYIKYKKNVASFPWDGERIQDRGFVSVLNNFLKKLFLSKTLKSYEKLNKPYWIIINNDMLKFHDRDIRKKIKKILT